MNTLEPPTVELPAQARRLLEIVQTGEGKFLKRSDIAKQLGKNRLNPSDNAYLDMLAVQGLIEMKQETNTTPIGYEWVYRAVSS